MKGDEYPERACAVCGKTTGVVRKFIHVLAAYHHRGAPLKIPYGALAHSDCIEGLRTQYAGKNN